MFNDLTVAVVTRKRQKLLARCLYSLAKQSVKVNKIIVIDNDEQKSSKNIVQHFQRRLPIKYVVEPRVGISYARNRALQVNRSKYLGFTDDDCVLNPDWVKNGLEGIGKWKSTYVVGKTKLMNPKSVVARVRFFYFQHWFKSNVDLKSKIINGQGLDTKNLILNTEKLRNKKIRFDPRFAVTSIGGGEDMDFGIQLDKLGLKGFYHDQMRLEHQEPDKVWQLMSKAYWNGRASFLLTDKWKLDSKYIEKQVDWKIWWEDFWLRPYTNKIYKKKFDFKKLWTHLLIKSYDRFWIEGYTKQRRMKAKQ
jgi:glycosyltransferase involved in cell wall biosynthesis